MATDENVGETPPREPDPDSSPFERPPIAGIPFGKNSEEARAIRRVIEQADRERAAAASGRDD
jgi:hypothetical protein